MSQGVIFANNMLHANPNTAQHSVSGGRHPCLFVCQALKLAKTPLDLMLWGAVSAAGVDIE